MVETITLDNYCRDNEISPDGIKIDVEGAENRVIAGCKEVLAKHSPWILLEIHGKWMTDKEKDDLWQQIEGIAQQIAFLEGKMSNTAMEMF